MSSLSILQEQTLQILQQIEYAIDTRDTIKDGRFEVVFGDIDLRVLRNSEDLYSVAKFLKTKGLDFEIVFDLVNDHPDAFVTSEIVRGEDVTLGYIKAKNISFIKTKIIELKNQITGSEEKTLKITLFAKKHELVIGETKIAWDSSSLEWSMFHIISSNGQETSWDEILEHYQGEKPYATKEQQKQVGDARDRINKKIIKKSSLKEELINRKKNQYKFTKKVTKK